jgi:hypothetical protein
MQLPQRCPPHFLQRLSSQPEDLVFLHPTQVPDDAMLPAFLIRNRGDRGQNGREMKIQISGTIPPLQNATNVPLPGFPLGASIAVSYAAS